MIVRYNEAKFKFVALEIYELLPLKIILEDLKVEWQDFMGPYFNNKFTINISYITSCNMIALNILGLTNI